MKFYDCCIFYFLAVLAIKSYCCRIDYIVFSYIFAKSFKYVVSESGPFCSSGIIFPSQSKSCFEIFERSLWGDCDTFLVRVVSKLLSFWFWLLLKLDECSMSCSGMPYFCMYWLRILLWVAGSFESTLPERHVLDVYNTGSTGKLKFCSFVKLDYLSILLPLL